MGKTTDAHIAKIQALNDLCAKPTIRFSTALTRAKAIHADCVAVEKTMTERHNAIFVGGSQSKEQEKAIARDPVYLKASAEFDAYNKMFEDQVQDQLLPARTALQQGCTALEKAIKEFEAFVTAKEKSWFGSKQSVPQARKAIQEGRKYLATLKGLVALHV
jgi:hypothetical protein